MHALSTTAMAFLGVIMALWLVGAAWAIYSGFAMRRRSPFTAEQADRLTTLLESAPALTVVARADGRIAAPARLAGWLGPDECPTCISHLVASEGGTKPKCREARPHNCRHYTEAGTGATSARNTQRTSPSPHTRE